MTIDEKAFQNTHSEYRCDMMAGEPPSFREFIEAYESAKQAEQPDELSYEVPFRIADHVEAMSEIVRMCKRTMKDDAVVGKPWIALDKINRIASRQLLLMKTPMQDS